VPGFPAVDKIFKETEKSLLGEALVRTAYKSEFDFVNKINEYHRLAGHVMLSDGRWVDPWPEWNKVKAEVETLKNAKEYPAAAAKLNGVDVVLLQNQNIATDVAAKRFEVIEHGKAEVIKDRDATNDFIDKKNFPEARKLIDRMKARYTDEVFGGADYWVADAPRLLDNKYETEEREDRSWLLRKVTSKTDNAMLQSQIGVRFGDYGSYEIVYDMYDASLRYHFNPGKTMIANTYGASINFIIPGGAKKISDFRTLSFFFHVDGGWDADITVTIDCGAGGSYQCVKRSAISGGTISANLFADEWTVLRAPNAVTDKPFQVVHSVGIQVTLKTRDGKAVQDDTFFEINSVQFVK
jgi:hypothetical protein